MVGLEASVQSLAEAPGLAWPGTGTLPLSRASEGVIGREAKASILLAIDRLCLCVSVSVSYRQGYSADPARLDLH